MIFLCCCWKLIKKWTYIIFNFSLFIFISFNSFFFIIDFPKEFFLLLLINTNTKTCNGCPHFLFFSHYVFKFLVVVNQHKYKSMQWMFPFLFFSHYAFKSFHSFYFSWLIFHTNFFVIAVVQHVYKNNAMDVPNHSVSLFFQKKLLLLLLLLTT